MDLTNLCPWNWLRNGPQRPRAIPVRRVEEPPAIDPDSMDGVYYEIDRLFDHAFSGFGFSAPHLRAAMDPADPGPHIRPDAQTTETGQGWAIAVALPGVRPRDIELELCGLELILRARRRAERGPEPVPFLRAFPLPGPCLPETLRAECSGSTLTLTLSRDCARPMG